jgi:type III secretion protein C
MRSFNYLPNAQSTLNRGLLSMNRICKVAAAVFAFAWLCTALPAVGATVHWKTSVVNYSAEGKDIKDVLRDFAASQGIPADIGSDVTGSFTGKFTLAPQKFLDTLAASFGFVWYFDGQLLSITSASDMKSALLQLNSGSIESLRDTLSEMGIEDPRFPITYNDAQGTALVNGPPRYVQMVSDVARRLDANAARRAGTEVRVFPLYHAWAEDRSIDVDGSSVTLQGVASVLRGLYHPDEQSGGGGASGSGGGRSGSTIGNMTRRSPMADVGGVPALPGANGSGGGNDGSNASQRGYLMPPLPNGAQGGIFGGLTGKPSPALAAIAAAPSGSGDTSAAGAPNDALPVIAADQRTNSVLIRDLPDRMYQYGELIKRLDVKPRLIEIEAHIIEVDDGALRQLGIDWTAHNSHVDLQSGTGLLPQSTYNGTLNPSFNTTTLADGSSVAATPLGMSLSAVLGDAGRYLMARISALQQENEAHIDESPKVVTLDNIEAVMENKTQFFVPVSGYTSADLYSVSAGVSLRVLPMVVEEQGKTQIKLDVAIEDGQIDRSDTVGNLPTVTSSRINTQAFIEQGQALLIAGYRTDNDSNNVTGVPGLSKIPLIGALFRTKNKQKSHMERLFLLLPKVIEP